MINHLEPMDIAMVRAIEDGTQVPISEFLDLSGQERELDDITRSHRVSAALRAYKAYLKRKGGEKTI